MDRLKQELAKKKQEREKMLSKLADAGKENKFVKLGDLKSLQNPVNQHSNQVAARGGSCKNSTDLSRNGESSSACNVQEEERKATLTRKEVVRRLREREKPIRLFGESDYEAFMRLKELEMLEPEVNKGFKNDFQDAMQKVDENYVKELLESTPGDEEKASSEEVKTQADETTYEEVMEMSEEFGKNVKHDSQVILKYLKLILSMWEDELNKRPEVIKRSLHGKLDSATRVQTVNYIKPLFRKLKKQTVSEDIFSCLVDIVKFLIQRDYLKATEAYLEMAIGNAPWPLGVTMVGIHARTGREKISDRYVAHVLNDETQRKYIQALKRLMTQAQLYFPTNRSRRVK